MVEKQTAALDVEAHEQLLETARMLLLVLGERHPSLRKRSERLANLCVGFGEALGLPEDELLFLFLAALLQNLGLVSIANERLAGPHALLEAPPPEIKRHPVAAVVILSASKDFETILPLVRHHHEDFDGRGYPDGLSGTLIPLGARILRLCDCFEELAWEEEGPEPGPARFAAALEKMKASVGTRFDPYVLEQFINHIDSGAALTEGYEARRRTAFIRESLAAILPKIRSGKIIPPAMPRVAWELRNLIKRSQVGLQEVCGIVERDPVISARLVSIANSPVYRGYGEIKNVQTAVPRLGYKEVLSIVVTIAHKNLYDVKLAHLRVLMDKLWVHSLACAFGAKALAQRFSLPEPETVFLMGLTHDIGKAVLLRAFCEQRAGRSLDAESVGGAIQELHQAVGVIVLKRWGFGPEFTRVVSLHERGDLGSDTVKEVLVVHLVNRLLRKLGFSLFAWDGTPSEEIPSAVLLGATAEVLRPIEASLINLVRDVAHLF